MVSKQRKTRGTILGLALTAMLAFGALGAGAAQASPTWHVNGKAFTGEASIESASTPFEFEIQVTNDSITCQSGQIQKTYSKIFAGDQGKAQFAFAECSLSKYCKVEPFGMSLEIDLIEVEGVVYQKFTPAGAGPLAILEYTGGYCSLSGIEDKLYGSFAARIGPEAAEEEAEEPQPYEAVQLPGSFSQASLEATETELVLPGWGSSVVIDGESLQRLTGMYTGQKWGAY